MAKKVNGVEEKIKINREQFEEKVDAVFSKVIKDLAKEGERKGADKKEIAAIVMLESMRMTMLKLLLSKEFFGGKDEEI